MQLSIYSYRYSTIFNAVKNNALSINHSTLGLHCVAGSYSLFIWFTVYFADFTVHSVDVAASSFSVDFPETLQS